MSEEIQFVFAGQLSDRHLMDFYEAGRFQYGASRLLVKLDQYRRSGKFAKKVTYTNKTRILLEAQRPGSFDISTLVPFIEAGKQAFLDVPLKMLWSYVADRVFKRAETSDIKTALATQNRLLDIFEKSIEGKAEESQGTLALLKSEMDHNRELSSENRQLYERLLTEKDRGKYLEQSADELKKISDGDDSELISMAAPLLKDMGVALRTSATSLMITSTTGGKTQSLMFVNRHMANEVNDSIIDKSSGNLLVDIVQYNKETGWGKFRSIEHGLVSFNVPSDRKANAQADLLRAMDEEETYVEVIFVRSIRGIVLRAIVISILDIEALEQQI